jgi:hypothetical protein
MLLHDSFRALEASWIGTAVTQSTWAFAALEAAHLLALAMVGGAVLVVDLRLLGFGLHDEPVARVAHAARPWLLGGLVAVVLTGIPLLASLAESKYYGNPAFWLKMYFLAGATVFTLTIKQRVVTGDLAPRAGLWAKAVAIVSLLLWVGVGIMGRAIGFY